jgi:L-amino acid N-acyltransferase YncA
MNKNACIEKIKRYRAKPMFFKIQSLLNKFPFQPVKISRFFMFSLDSVPNEINARGTQIIRLATSEDIEGMCLLENKPILFKTWLGRGERCVVAVDNDEIVGFEWFSAAGFYLEERFNYKIIIPPDAVYTYDAYIKENFRLRGIWVQFQALIKQWMDSNNKKKIIALIDYGNDHSIKTHVRFGFQIYQDVIWINVFGKNFTIEKELSLNGPEIRKVLIR